MPSITVRARSYRNLENLDWSPAGVCLLCGPNGAGKSTTLSVFRFLRTLFERGHEGALSAVGGQHFRRIGAPEEEPVLFEVEAGDVLWRLRFPMSLAGLKGAYGEEIHREKKLVLRAAMFEETYHLEGERHPRDEVRCCAKALWDRGDADWMKPLVDAISGIRIYTSYWLNQIQRHEQTDPAQSTFLTGNGRNLWSVLANWKQSPIRYRGQFEAVLTAARAAFPALLSTIEFDRGLPFLYQPGATDPEHGLPPGRVAEGLLTGLLHLTAVIGARQGSIVAIDEMENQLHPHAIRSLVATMRKQAEEKDLTIILTTHSPVVMNTFRDEPEQVYVLDQSVRDRALPVAMTDLHSEEWLAQAKLGTLYDQLAFAAPAFEGAKP